MTDIEERAYVKFPIHSDKEMEEEYIKPRREAYIAHCKEQKAIDIENACKTCENELRRIKSLLNEAGIPSNLISVGQSLSNIMREMHENN